MPGLTKNKLYTLFNETRVVADRVWTENVEDQEEKYHLSVGEAAYAVDRAASQSPRARARSNCGWPDCRFTSTGSPVTSQACKTALSEWSHWTVRSFRLSSTRSDSKYHATSRYIFFLIKGFSFQCINDTMYAIPGLCITRCTQPKHHQTKKEKKIHRQDTSITSSHLCRRRAYPNISRPSMSGKNVPRRMLQPCRRLHKKASMFHTLESLVSYQCATVGQHSYGR